jgi:hypothetical protein
LFSTPWCSFPFSFLDPFFSLTLTDEPCALHCSSPGKRDIGTFYNSGTSLRRLDIFIFLLHFHPAFIYLCTIFLIVLYILQLTSILYCYHQHNRARSHRFRPLTACCSLVSAPLSHFCACLVFSDSVSGPSRSRAIFSLRNPLFPLASALHVGIYTKPDRSIAPHHALRPAVICFVLGMAITV